MSNDHTPTPWKRSGGTTIAAAGIPVVATVPLTFVSINQQNANAELIVRACNAHDELVAACELALKRIEFLNAYADKGGMPALAMVKGYDNYVSPIRAALTKATEEA